MSNITLGVTGGIGAYKAVEIVRGLQKAGHDVVVVMTEAATRFVGPLTFEAITRRRVLTEQFEPGANADIAHIQLATDTSLLLIAPATANCIGKLANGIADDFLSALYLATRAPVLLAPAMNTVMWEHEAVRRNLQLLRERGAEVVEPGEGFLACGWMGKGRLADPDEIVGRALSLLLRPGTMSGRKLLVTAGPTFEDIDPVRYVGNRSSGRMGFAVAAEAARRGAEVTVVAGPVTVPPPHGVAVVHVRSAARMRDEVVGRAAAMDAVVMAAAVADYAPDAANEKIAKDAGELRLVLKRTSDILLELGRARAAGALPGTILVGFAAETGDLVARAREKRERKQVDLIVGNDVSRSGAGFDTETNAVVLVDRDGEEELPLQSKAAVAGAILDRVERMLAARGV